MKSIAEAWESYRLILPQDAGANQIIETRRAFYAGARALQSILMTQLEPGEEPTAADLAFMDSLDTELSDFARDVVQGRA